MINTIEKYLNRFSKPSNSFHLDKSIRDSWSMPKAKNK